MQNLCPAARIPCTSPRSVSLCLMLLLLQAAPPVCLGPPWRPGFPLPLFTLGIPCTAPRVLPSPHRPTTSRPHAKPWNCDLETPSYDSAPEASGARELVCMCVCVCVLVAQPCLTLCNPMDCSPPSSSVHGFLQAGILGWVDISFSRGSS